MAACHRLSSNRFAAFADSLKSKTWTSVPRVQSFIARMLHPLNSRIEEACDNRWQSVHFYEALDREPIAFHRGTHNFPRTFSRGICMRNGTKFAPGSSLPMERKETERDCVRIPRKERKRREKKENLDVRGAGIFVECVSRITGSYQYALTLCYNEETREDSDKDTR